MVTIEVYPDSEQPTPAVTTALIYRATWRDAAGVVIETAAAFGDLDWGMVKFHRPAPMPADWSPAGEVYCQSAEEALWRLAEWARGT